MNAMKKKLNKTSGFTLVEMLIVVAIIAILIAISIPLVSSTLEKARHSVDDANMRDAQSLATVYYLTLSQDAISTTINESTDGIAAKTLTLNYYINDNKQGMVAKAENAPEGYVQVKSTCTNSSDSDCASHPALGTPLTITIDINGNIVATGWDVEDEEGD